MLKARAAEPRSAGPLREGHARADIAGVRGRHLRPGAEVQHGKSVLGVRDEARPGNREGVGRLAVAAHRGRHGVLVVAAHVVETCHAALAVDRARGGIRRVKMKHGLGERPVAGFGADLGPGEDAHRALLHEQRGIRAGRPAHGQRRRPRLHEPADADEVGDGYFGGLGRVGGQMQARGHGKPMENRLRGRARADRERRISGERPGAPVAGGIGHRQIGVVAGRDVELGRLAARNGAVEEVGPRCRREVDELVAAAPRRREDDVVTGQQAGHGVFRPGRRRVPKRARQFVSAILTDVLARKRAAKRHERVKRPTDYAQLSHTFLLMS